MGSAYERALAPLPASVGRLGSRMNRATAFRRLARLTGSWLLVTASVMVMSAATASAASVIATPIRAVHTAYGTIGYRSVGHGRPLVLIMGLSGSIDAWQPAFIDSLARHHRVITFDNEGIGKSTLRPGALTITRMGDDTAALISALHLRRPDVLGWSMGGFIAQAFAVRHPHDLRRLILSATAAGDGHATLPSAAVIKLLAGGGASIVNDLFPSDRSHDAGAYIAAITHYPNFYLPSAAISAMQLTASARWFAGGDPAGHHDGRLRVPTLVGDGLDDVLVPAIDSRRLAHLIPRAALKLFPDAGHAFLFQDESSWVPLIEHFLAAPH